MLSIARCRKLLPNQKSYSDAEVEEFRQHFYGLARIMVKSFKKTASENPQGVEMEVPLTPVESFDYEFEERAGIHQFDGNATREESERLAAQVPRRDGV